MIPQVVMLKTPKSQKGGPQNIILKIFVDLSPEKNKIIGHVEDNLLLPPHHDPIWRCKINLEM